MGAGAEAGAEWREHREAELTGWRWTQFRSFIHQSFNSLLSV
jgi:hypothetical protein